MKASVVVLNYNGKKCLGRCLKSLERLDFPRYQYEIIAVDNNSSDKSFKIARRFKRVKLIRNRENLGFCMGNNIGIRESKGKYVVLLNNDTFVNREWLKELVDVVERDKSVGAVGSKIFYSDNGIWFSGGKVYFGGFCNHHNNENEFGECDYVSGCSILLRRDLLDKIGMLDERFEYYYEEADICRRIRKRGFKIIYNPKSIVYHDVERDNVSGHLIYYLLRNRVLYCVKDLNFLNKALFLILDTFLFFPVHVLFWILKNKKVFLLFGNIIRARIDSYKMAFD